MRGRRDEEEKGGGGRAGDGLWHDGVAAAGRMWCWPSLVVRLGPCWSLGWHSVAWPRQEMWDTWRCKA